MNLRAISTSAVVALMAGCYGAPDRPDTNPTTEGSPFFSLSSLPVGGVERAPPRAPPSASTPVTGTTSGDRLAGEMGAVRGFSSDSVEVRTSRGGSTIRLDAVDPAARWWVMTQLEFSSPLSDPAWAPGMTRTFEASAPSADGLSVRGLGCSGPTRGRIVFDAVPEQVTVNITTGPTLGSRVFQFTERWAETAQTVTGSFEYTPP